MQLIVRLCFTIQTGNKRKRFPPPTGCDNWAYAECVYGEGSAVEVAISETTITITAYVSISGPLRQDIIKEAIEEYWSGTFYVDGKPKLLHAEIIIGSNNGNSVRIYTYDEEGVSNVKGAHDNWRINNYGEVHLYNGLPEKTFSLDRYKHTVAHEFGHVVGLYDAYNLKEHITSIMNRSGTHLQNIDVQKVTEAFRNNRRSLWTKIIALIMIIVFACSCSTQTTTEKIPSITTTETVFDKDDMSNDLNNATLKEQKNAESDYEIIDYSNEWFQSVIRTNIDWQKHKWKELLDGEKAEKFAEFLLYCEKIGNKNQLLLHKNHLYIQIPLLPYHYLYL